MWPSSWVGWVAAVSKVRAGPLILSRFVRLVRRRSACASDAVIWLACARFRSKFRVLRDLLDLLHRGHRHSPSPAKIRQDPRERVMIENRVMILTVVCWSFVSPLPHWCSEYECSRCAFCERGRRSLQATARAAAPNNRPVGDKRRRPCVALSLRLDWLPSRRQYLISMGTGIENHVVYLSLERLCLQAGGRTRVFAAT